VSAEVRNYEDVRIRSTNRYSNGYKVFRIAMRWRLLVVVGKSNRGCLGTIYPEAWALRRCVMRTIRRDELTFIS
jgi:hypothetical protein